MEEEEEEEEVVGRERYSTQPWDIQYNHLCRLLFREGEAFYLLISNEVFVLLKYGMTA